MVRGWGGVSVRILVNMAKFGQKTGIFTYFQCNLTYLIFSQIYRYHKCSMSNVNMGSVKNWYTVKNIYLGPVNQK